MDPAVDDPPFYLVTCDAGQWRAAGFGRFVPEGVPDCAGVRFDYATPTSVEPTCRIKLTLTNFRWEWVNGSISFDPSELAK